MVREISRQPLGAKGLGPTKNKGRVSADCPSQPGRDNRHLSCESREARANQRGQAHSTPKLGGDDRLPSSKPTGTTASGALLSSSPNLGYLGTPKSKISLGERGRVPFIDRYTRGRSFRPRPQRGLRVAQSKRMPRKRRRKGLEPSALNRVSGIPIRNGKQPPPGLEARHTLYAGEGAHHRGAAAEGSAERRRGAGPVPGKEQREVELGHRVPLPTRGTTFRLRICCRSPADTPLPPLPSCSISPPFTAKTWGRAPEVLLWLALA